MKKISFELRDLCEVQGKIKITNILHQQKNEEFNANMFSVGVLKIDFCQYLEDSWPMDDEVWRRYINIIH